MVDTYARCSSPSSRTDNTVAAYMPPSEKPVVVVDVPSSMSVLSVVEKEGKAPDPGYP
jgi:hypothetical protein